MPRQPFLALITPIGDSGPVDPGYFPPGVGIGNPGGPGGPGRPIAGWPGGLPGGGGFPGQGGPVDPGYNPPGVGGPGSRPPSGPVDPGWVGGWVPVDPGYGIPETGRPIVSPPIYYPPGNPVDPAWGIDEDDGYLRPSQPIYLPPEMPGTNQKIEWKTAWSEQTGWVVIGVPTGEHPTPSSKSSGS